MKKRLLSGVKPTGAPHIGNYFGAMRQFVDLQDEYESFVMIADYHALNFIHNKQEMEKNILDVTLDYLGIGIDPEKVIIFKQSDISAHTELAWIFDTITTMPYLMRAHAYKDAEAKNAEINVGTFNYPMLMAADILLYDPEIVPVGSDQKQHVEYARDTAQKFNKIYGDTFILPKELIMKDVATIPGTDGQKMSKSYKNTIPLFGTDEEIKKAVMGIVTDSKTPEEPKNPDECNIFALHKLFLQGEQLQNLRDKYSKGGMSYKESKEMLFEEILALVKPMRERREMYRNNIDTVKEILNKGKEKAKSIADTKMNIIRSNIGVNI
ncbi:MAG: tryptophan--tRNA ligase [Patescibacteria group bacterium]|nr:tryptophan--tRNA ligase [Patescibacteria group bacterium]